MFDDILMYIYILAGAFIGWNFPQPQIAKTFQDKYIMPIWPYIKGKVPFIN